MNITETIENLILKKNCETVTFGKTPTGGIFVAVHQGVATGPGDDNSSLCVHQQAGGKLGEMFNKIVSQIDYCEGISLKIVERSPRTTNN